MINGIKEEKIRCERVGRRYIPLFECILGVLRYMPFDMYPRKEVCDKLEDLVIQLDTGKMEIIEFGEKVE